MSNVNVSVAFIAGVVSFMSPCSFPLYPSYLAYITGMSVQQMKNGHKQASIRLYTMKHTLAFVLGFSIVFYSLGYGSGMLGHFFYAYKDAIRQLCALFMVSMGLFLLGVFEPKWLMKERRLGFKFSPTGYFSSFLCGIGFSTGWSPCIGPILAAIVALSATEPTAWFTLMTGYVMGFAVPFFGLSFFVGSVGWMTKHCGIVMKIGGAMLLLVGLCLFFNWMTSLTRWLY